MFRCVGLYWLYGQLFFLGSGLMMGFLLLCFFGAPYLRLSDVTAERLSWLIALPVSYMYFYFYWRRFLRKDVVSPQRLTAVIILYFFVCTAVFAAGFYQARGSVISLHSSWAGMLLPVLSSSFLPLLFTNDLRVVLYYFGGIQLVALAFLARYYFLERHTHLPYLKLLAALTAIAAMGAAAVNYTIKNSDVIPTHHLAYERGLSSTDLWAYKINNKENLLPPLAVTSTLLLAEQDWLVLDGAEAAFPVYSAAANACYDGIRVCDREKLERYVSFHNTIYGFERLLDKKVDVFFGAMPSAAQYELARQRGEELALTPIGREAFVFFVHRDNPLQNLAVEDIRDIYSGRVCSWQKYTGEDKRILAFQRPENSGSQTLLQHIMGEAPIAPSLKEEYIGGMGGIYSRVAAYNGDKSAIGYSFRFFASGMTRAQEEYRPKFISINGVYPDDTSIKDGSYPFATRLYAVTLKSNGKQALPRFLEWLQGEQGQEIIEKIGYVKL